MNFEEFWSYHGQRNLAFSAKEWAKAGWKGHEIHGGDIIDADVPLLEDVSCAPEYKDVLIAHLAKGVTVSLESADDLLRENLKLGRVLTEEESSQILSPINKEKK